MERLVRQYLNRDRVLRIADIGSFRVDERNLSYRTLVDSPAWTYVGVDIAKGPNIDVVMESPYRLPFSDSSVDVIFCGQVFEHIEFFWLTINEMSRILRPGGMVFLIAPSRGFDHKYPVDCWRFYPDAFRALAKWSGLELLEVQTDGTFEQTATDLSLARRLISIVVYLIKMNLWTVKYFWGDTVGVFKKSESSGTANSLVPRITGG